MASRPPIGILPGKRRARGCSYRGLERVAGSFTAEALRAREVYMPPEAFIELVREVLDHFQWQSRPGAEELPPQEAAILAEGMRDLPELNEETRDFDPVVAAAVETAVAVAASLSVEQAAELLGTTRHRVRERIRTRTLYAFQWHRRWRLPRWQFLGLRELPGLALVLASLDPEVSPAEIAIWMETPDAELTTEGSDTPLSPYEWLSLGLPPEKVAPLAEGFAEIP